LQDRPKRLEVDDVQPAQEMAFGHHRLVALPFGCWQRDQSRAVSMGEVSGNLMSL
jgi:hypothetical protein